MSAMGDLKGLHGTSVFAKGEDGQIYHVYSTYVSAAEQTLMLLDLAPKGAATRRAR